jgi:hypothetical protein
MAGSPLRAGARRVDVAWRDLDRFRHGNHHAESDHRSDPANHLQVAMSEQMALLGEIRRRVAAISPNAGLVAPPQEAPKPG